MLSQEAVEKILGIKEKTTLTPKEMADKLNITFYPISEPHRVSPQIKEFNNKLRAIFQKLDINVVPYTEALETVPLKRRLKRGSAVFFNNILYGLETLYGKKEKRHFINFQTLKGILKRQRIKPGISIIAQGENNIGNLPIEKTSSFRHGSVITVLDKPSTINKSSNFYDHFDTAMSLFAYHMTNIVILVDKNEWILYNFNASHPTYNFTDTFEKGVLYGLIPKIVAPILPYRFSDFVLFKDSFDIHDDLHSSIVKDLIEGGKLLEQSGLYPKGKKIDDLPFRTDFYRWIGKIHLDNRSGMSYGFLAYQMPQKLSPLILFTESKNYFGEEIKTDKDYFFYNNDLYIIIELKDGKFFLKVPEVWILSQRSGSNKTNMQAEKDLVNLGLKNGKMYLATPQGLKLKNDYKPSFDTGVILAHAVGNAIVASILNHYNPNDLFAKRVHKRGLSISHWHGYINPKFIPTDWFAHGQDNPHVSCSSPQSAIYAMQGKFKVFLEAHNNRMNFAGDIHIEPHHGTNINFTSLQELGTFFLKNKEVASLGNKYLSLYDI
ncbi:MAG: hypothetical protein Q7R49_01995 [Candidatus Daviesbacteria bacterium]|nr:hypothetical protein [Candidatus Daviesbacteria bacterium]